MPPEGRWVWAGVVFFLFSVGMLRAQWQVLPTPASLLLSEIHFVDAYTSWVAGDSGLILHTVDGGVTRQVQPSPVQTQIVDLFFSGSVSRMGAYLELPCTTFSHRLPQAAFVTLKIRNLLGRRVALPVRGRQPPGEDRVIWRPHKAAAGVYFCRLKVGKQEQIHKLLFVP